MTIGLTRQRRLSESTRSPVQRAHCTLHIAHCTLHIAHCTLQIADCTLQIAHWTADTTTLTQLHSHQRHFVTHCVLHFANFPSHCTFWCWSLSSREALCSQHNAELEPCRANSTRLGAIDRDWPILFPLHVKIIIMYILKDQIPNEDHTSTEIVWLKNYPQQAPITKVWISSVLLFFRRVKETLRKSLNSLEQKINLVCKVFLFVFQKTNKTTLNLNFSY